MKKNKSGVRKPPEKTGHICKSLEHINKIKMKKDKLFCIVAFFALSIVLLLSVSSFAQGNKFVGKWVFTPEAPSNIISHLTISEKGNGFEIFRTKAPEEKWSALFDTKTLKMVAIIDGKMVYFTYDNKTGKLNLFDFESDAKISELKKE
jgi:hypothetical protein